MNVDVDFRRIQDKMNYHRKMGLFYRQYLRAVQVVESFDSREREIETHRDRFCDVGNCLETVRNNKEGALCPRHEIIMERRAMRDEDYLG